MADFVEKIITKLVENGRKYASFSITLPDGTILKTGDKEEEFKVDIKSAEVFSQVVLKGELAIGEQYMLGNIIVEGSLAKCLSVLAKIANETVDVKQNKLSNAAINFTTKIFKNNRHRSLKNVAYHYDLGNDFYKTWLDKTMTYSCAYFKDTNDSIDKAQEQKLEHICKKLMLKEGEGLLDIGSGWGSMLIYAAKNYKVKGYGVTLSKEQLELAEKKAREEGVEDLVKFELKDYRDISGTFDKVVSIGMFEHIGYKYYDSFFSTIKKVLKPQGIALLHTIGIVETNYDNSKFGWILKYIFPGGYLPSPEQVFKNSSRYDFVPLDLENLRMHYARTLNKWSEAYEKVLDKTAEDRGPEFARMWKYYLALSEAAFENNVANLYQFTFSNGPNNDLPLTREYIYK